MLFKKKPVVIEAARWFKNGDHPEDDPTRGGTTLNGELWEGLIVRYFRRPDVSGDIECKHCGQPMHDHGWIDTLEGGHIVCPGDWIITGVQGERYPCKPNIFAKTYEPVEASTANVPEGYVLVPVEIIDRFQELNPSNYDHDGVCALNAWVVEREIHRAPVGRPVQCRVMQQEAL